MRFREFDGARRPGLKLFAFLQIVLLITVVHDSVGHADEAELISDESSVPLASSKSQRWFDTVQRDMNPANDGWDTELFSEKANQQLKQLGKLMLSAQAATLEEIEAIVDPKFACTPLRPGDLREVFVDDSVTVWRAARLSAAVTGQGPSGLADAISQLSEEIREIRDKHYKFKLFQVVPRNDSIETTSFLEISGRKSGEALQRSATWKCRWTDDDHPRLLSIAVTDYEEARVVNQQQTLFSDVTKSLLRDAPFLERQFGQGIDFWRSRIENYQGIYFNGLHGLMLGDVNGDGLDDVYLCEPGGLPNRLLLQTPDGLIRNASASSGIDLLDSTRCGLFVDLDNDGDQDVVLPVAQQVQFYANDGTGHFTLQTQIPIKGPSAYALSAADYDEDGRVDIYLGYYFGVGEDESNRLPAPIPLHDARTGGPNYLLRNVKDWQFEDVTAKVGLDHNNDRWTFAVTWEDYDNDGDIDLYVANDFGRNNLYRNTAGKFRDVAADAGAEDMNFGMSATFGDYDRDGLMDLYVSNMFSAAGGRITGQEGFQTDGPEAVKTAYQRMARGNTLLRNTGDGRFEDVSDTAKVSMGRWAWASLFADINNDGWEDLLVANGFVTGHLPGDL